MNDGAEMQDSSRQYRDAQADALAASLPIYASSVCLTCASHRTIVSGKGSVFMLCRSHDVPANWPKYPSQPKSHCDYYQDTKPDE